MFWCFWRRRTRRRLKKHVSCYFLVILWSLKSLHRDFAKFTMHDPIAKIHSAKITVFWPYALKVFAVSNECALNVQGFFNLYFLHFCLLKDYLFVLSRWKKTQMGEEQIVMRINLISQTPTEKYNNSICWYIEMIRSFVLNRYSDGNSAVWLFLNHQTFLW